MEKNEQAVSKEDQRQPIEECCEEAPNEEKELTVIDKAKNVLATGKERVIEFWDGNKHWIVPVAGAAAAAVAAIVKQAIDNNELKQENQRLSGEVDDLRQENQALNDENDYVTGRLIASYERHAEKDAWMDAVASDDLRRGGSLGGQVLRSKRDYIQEQEEF